jgi:DNA-binding NtrC family response regulator
MRPASALIVDLRPTVRAFSEAFARLGLNAVYAEREDEGLQRLEELGPAVVLLAVEPNDLPGLRLLKRLTESRQTPVIAVVESGNLRVAVEAMRAGAIDVLDKCATVTEIEQAIQPVLTDTSVHGYEKIFCHSPKMQAVGSAVARAATVLEPVLVRGESGVGKEIVAQAIHRLSSRSDQPFFKLTWVALPAENVVNELETILAAAPDGTLFLDEIGEAPAAAQARLLSSLAGEASKPRLVAATSADMNRLVTGGVFLKELYERLTQTIIDVPPLRDRREEIEALTHHFFARFARQFHRPIPALTESMAQFLRGYDWPGNVRELESVVKRWVVLGGEDSVRAEIAARQVVVRRKHAASTGAGLGLLEIGRQAARDAERAALQEALLRARGNRAAVARELKVSYRTLLQKLAETGLAPTPIKRRA